MNKTTRRDVLDLVERWQKILKVNVKRVQIREMKRKWASFLSRGTLTLNKDLLDLPKKYTEYVIVHELLHGIVPNHGRTFKTLLHMYLPDWEHLHRYLTE